MRTWKPVSCGLNSRLLIWYPVPLFLICVLHFLFQIDILGTEDFRACLSPRSWPQELVFRRGAWIGKEILDKDFCVLVKGSAIGTSSCTRPRMISLLIVSGVEIYLSRSKRNDSPSFWGQPWKCVRPLQNTGEAFLCAKPAPSSGTNHTWSRQAGRQAGCAEREEETPV